jgi:hypothetical protein
MLHFRSSEVGALRVINFVLVYYVKVPRELGAPVDKYEDTAYSPLSWYGSDGILNSK